MSNAPLYTVITLAEALQDPATRDWLALAGVSLPEELPPGCDPTPAEMRSMLENMPGLRVACRVTETTWQASVTSRKDVSWSSLRFRDYTGNLDERQKFCFEAGWDELILLIAVRMAGRCGPLVLLHDSGAPPQVVY